jgi:predicted transcriptional regulator
LYNKGNIDSNANIGANAYTIQHKANIPSQESNRFKGFLQDLCNKNCLQIYNEETGGEKVIIKYRITQKGKDVVHQYRKSFIHEIFGSVEDLFETKL